MSEISMFRIFFFLIFLLPLTANASPLNGLNKYGEGEMDFLFWRLYKAELFGEGVDYSISDRKLTLKITYQRDIDKADLIQATEKQWQHIELTHENMQEWIRELHTIWPNIKKGDVLIVTTNPDKTATFYNRDKQLGTIQDPDFTFAFLSIWLSENTSRPKLRKALIGHN